MENVAQAIRQGVEPASGAAAIIVEKHKSNFMTQHGTFEDKPAQNITRWLEKADTYKKSHMINSLEMASIVTYCIKGEPRIKVQRMIDVPGVNYINADHYSEQPLQRAVLYQAYRDRVPPVPADPGPQAAEILSRPCILPMRHEPQVLPNQCLRFYLLQLYQKRVNLAEADKFLSTFKIQKPKQTCSNYLDEFVINYESYAHLKWTQLQLNGVAEIQAVQANAQVVPAVLAVEHADEIPGNSPLRAAEMIQMVTDGICKEFKIHCDNLRINLSTITFPLLEEAVMDWQRYSTTGKQFTLACVPAKLATKSAYVSSMETDDHTGSDYDEWTSLDEQTSAMQISSNQGRGQRGGRGNRGTIRGARGRGGRGRGATTNSGSTPNKQFVSRDTQDGNHANYRQKQDGSLHRSVLGYPLCNYCGAPSHKRERCPAKAADREAGLTRTVHPDRDKYTNDKQKTTTPSTPVAASMTTAPQFHPWQFPWTYPHTNWMQQPPMQGNNIQWQQPQQPQPMEQEQKSAAIQANPMSAATQPSSQTPCPYPTCQAILFDPHQAQEHIRMCHSAQTSMTTGPGFNP